MLLKFLVKPLPTTLRRHYFNSQWHKFVEQDGRYLYHYTDQATLHKILASRILMPSASSAMLGPGVYLTALPPGVGCEWIKMNNWNSKCRTNQADCFLQFCKMCLPSVRQVQCARFHLRDVWICPITVSLDLSLISFGFTSNATETIRFWDHFKKWHVPFPVLVPFNPTLTIG